MGDRLVFVGYLSFFNFRVRMKSFRATFTFKSKINFSTENLLPLEDIRVLNTYKNEQHKEPFNNSNNNSFGFFSFNPINIVRIYTFKP